MPSTDYAELYQSLSRQNDLIRNTVYQIAGNLGAWEELNAICESDIRQVAKDAPAQLRDVCLLANLIGTCSLFATLKRRTDVGFRRHADAFRDEGFVQFCSDTTRIRGLPSRASRFILTFEEAVPLYDAVVPMTNKQIAHLSVDKFERPFVGDVLNLSRVCIQLMEFLEIISGNEVGD